MTQTLPPWFFFVPSVLGLQIGTFVLIADQRSLLNRLVFLTSLAVSLWNLENVWEMASLPPAAVFWVRLGGIFLPVLSLHVLTAWCGRTGRPFSAFLTLGYAWALLVVLSRPRILFSPTPANAPAGPVLPPYALTPGFLSYILYVLAVAALSAYLLQREFQAVRGQERVKVSLVASSALAAVLTAALGLFYHRGYPFHALNAATTLVYLASLAWAVVRYRFGNPSLALRTSAVYSLVLSVTTGLYVLTVLLLTGWLQAWQRWNPFVVAFFCVLTVGPLFYPLQGRLLALLRRFFPLPRDLYYEGLKHFLGEISVLSPLPNLASLIVSRLTTLFELPYICLLVEPATAPPFLVSTEAGWSQLATLPVFETQREWSLADLRRLSGLPLASVLPLAGRTRPMGLLAVGRHADGSPLTTEEREVLTALVRQAGVALENAELYAELVELKNHYQTVIQSTGNALLVVDPQGLVEEANQAAANLFGPAEGLVGQPVELATRQDVLKPLVAQAMAGKSPLTGRELALSGPEGVPIPCAVSVSPLLDPVTGECSGAVVTLADLSPIRAMERQVERAERLSALGQLTAGLAHELRNGLNKIAGYATMLADELSPSDPHRRLPLGILEDAANLENMLRRFLAFAREEKLSRSPVALPALLEKVLLALEPEFRTRHVRLVRQVDSSVPPVQGDAAQLAQAMTNVLLNAVEAMGYGGTLTVSLRRVPDGLELRVTDTGPGIPPDQQELVFNPFFTTKPEGTGLGLSITHRIITRHGGTVRLHSKPGRGTTVGLVLPLEPGA
ncbi:MAG: ATP-binding protein [Betaproteobacteria bacterium]